jgi:hypothetical protein
MNNDVTIDDLNDSEDCCGCSIRIDKLPVIEQVRNSVRRIAEAEPGLLNAPLQVKIRKLPPEVAIGENTDKDYPIYKGKEGILEAQFLTGKGQAFSPVPVDFDGELGDVLDLDLVGTDETAVRNRGVFVAAINAMCAHLGIAEKTVHCKDENLRECAKDLLVKINSEFPKETRITLIGCQPRMIEVLAPAYNLRVIDLDPDNIGKPFSGVIIEGDDKTDEALEWCDLTLVTGSTLANGTIDRFIGLKCTTIFYGITIAGVAALLNLPRFCARGQ